MKKLMIYGAAGYTGRMAAQCAAAAGTPLILAGRREAPLLALPARLDVEYRVFALDDSAVVDGHWATSVSCSIAPARSPAPPRC